MNNRHLLARLNNQILKNCMIARYKYKRSKDTTEKAANKTLKI